jgi:hypothetical protein
MFAASHPELTRSVILLGRAQRFNPSLRLGHALQIIFNLASTDADVLKVMPYLVSSPADSARVWRRAKA